MGLTKSQFRTTMCTVWGTFNSILVIIFLINGRFAVHEAKVTGLLLLVIPPVRGPSAGGSRRRCGLLY